MKSFCVNCNDVTTHERVEGPFKISLECKECHVVWEGAALCPACLKEYEEQGGILGSEREDIENGYPVKACKRHRNPHLKIVH